MKVFDDVYVTLGIAETDSKIFDDTAYPHITVAWSDSAEDVVPMIKDAVGVSYAISPFEVGIVGLASIHGHDVILVESFSLQEVWNRFNDVGQFSWTFPHFIPHVSYSGNYGYPDIGTTFFTVDKLRVSVGFRDETFETLYEKDLTDTWEF